MHAEMRRRQAQINEEIRQQQKQAKANESAKTLAPKNESERQQKDKDTTLSDNNSEVRFKKSCFLSIFLTSLFPLFVHVVHYLVCSKCG